MSLKADVLLDAKGLACPMPIVKTKKAMADLEDGQIIEVSATDRGSKADIAAWAETVGHQYIGTIEENDVLKHYIRKGSNDTIIERTHDKVLQNEDLLSKVAEGEILLDVREVVEYAFGHIEGAMSIPLGDLEKRMSQLDKNTPIYVICRSGQRSDLAAQKLSMNGFKNVWNVIPGMSAWKGNVIKEI